MPHCSNCEQFTARKMCKLEGQFAMLLTTLFCLLLCVSAYRNEEVYRREYGVGWKKLETLYENVLRSGEQDYLQSIVRALENNQKDACYVKTFQTTNSNYILLDLCNKIDRKYEKLLHGSELLNYISGLSEHESESLDKSKTLTMWNEIQEINHGSDGSQFVTAWPCVVYNISGMQDKVTYHSCDPWNIRHLLKEALHPISSITKITLDGIPIQNLLTEDLTYFPNLKYLILDHVPLTSESLERKLLCASPHLEQFYFFDSLGYLQKFPSHIFNCSETLNVTLINFVDHNIAYLPEYAFQSAAHSVKYLRLENLGLETIHKDAFFGVLTLEVLGIMHNRITAPIHVCSLIPPSEELMILQMVDSHFNISVDLNMLKLAEKHLQFVVISWRRIYDLKGGFCSFESHSNLTLISLHSSVNSLCPPLLDNCISLKQLQLSNKLEYLDVALFARNVSLEVLHLSHNKLTDNTSWSGLLAQQHELQYLNLSGNRLTSWTQNISAVWKLKQLDISYNSIEVINAEAFKNLTQLELLSLEGNRLYESDFLCMLPSLHVINLAGNLLTSVSCLQNIRNAYLIDVASNNISELVLGAKNSCSVFPCQDVTLHAENNRLTSVVLSCSDTQRYTMVDLSNNNLTDFLSIFPDIRKESCNVDAMNVSWNRFNELVGKNNPMLYPFKDPHHVANLDMTHCRLRIVTHDFGIYFVSKTLDLQYNMVNTFIPMYFPHNNRLKIDVRNNPLVCKCNMHWLKKYLHNQYQSKELENVEYSVSKNCFTTLWYEDKLIQSLPDDMFLCPQTCPPALPMKCTNITCYTRDYSGLNAVTCSGYISGLSSVLDVIKTQIHITDGHIPLLELNRTNATELQFLNLTECHIIDISSGTFRYTPRLQGLVLPCNLISTVSESTFDHLYQLRYLDLSHNLLQAIEANTFRPLGSLETVLLHSNQLSSFNNRTLNILQRLKNVSLYNNTWECTCDSSFRLWIIENEKILNDPQKIQCDGSGSAIMLSNIPCIQNRLTRTQIIILSALAVLFVMILTTCTVLCNKYRFELLVLLFRYFPNCFKYHDNEDGPCGIFAVYDNQAPVAYMWVKDHLIPHVEPACPLICYNRDFLGGYLMMDNVEDAIKRTNCAVLLLTENFLQNHWSIAMFQSVFITMIERKRPYKIIPVFGHGVSVNDIIKHKDCPADLRVLLKTYWVLDLSNKMFWESLLYLLPDPCKARILSDPDNGERDFLF